VSFTTASPPGSQDRCPRIKKGVLVGGFNNLEKYQSVGINIPYMKWKIKTVPNHQPGFHRNIFFQVA
jgi:hypothetical protein